jgi:spectinomycin phosphotransferase
VLTRPGDLTDADVVGALRDGWGIAARNLAYAAVGYGSHHWHVTTGLERWFVSIDDLEARRWDATETRRHAADRLSAALTVARSLQDAGLDFVVAPTPATDGAIIRSVNNRYVIALYPHIEGEPHPWGPYPNGDARLTVLDRLVDIHAISPSVAPTAMRDDFAIPARDQLEITLTNSDTPWGPGPFTSPARDLLGRHNDSLRRALARYDELALQISRRPERFVLTHGEPHRGNTIDTADGVVLIDWDTALLAAPERDLWMLIDEDPSIAEAYTRRTGLEVDHAALEFYRLWWDLCEISLFTAALQQPHEDTVDTRLAWEQLAIYVRGVVLRLGR